VAKSKLVWKPHKKNLKKVQRISRSGYWHTLNHKQATEMRHLWLLLLIACGSFQFPGKIGASLSSFAAYSVPLGKTN